MDFKTYLSGLSADEKKALASAAGTEVIYLIQIAGDHARPSAKLANRIAAASGGKVTAHELRPDIFGEPPPASPPEPAQAGAL